MTPHWLQIRPQTDRLQHEVHLWRIALDCPSTVAQACSSHLDGSERLRVSRFHFAEDAQRFSVAHGATRMILGHYLGVEPKLISYQTAAFGKPELAGALLGDSLRFNLSHSHQLALLAVTRNREVGVDLEFVRPLPDFLEVARSFFARLEVQELEQIADEPGRTTAFYRCWTAKEAFVKAIGNGLSHPLDTFSVSFLPGQPAHLRSVAGKDDWTAAWSITTFDPHVDYAAALVVSGDSPPCRCFQWSPDDAASWG